MNILVTGGASGLGNAITTALANDKNNFVYFTYCNSKENALDLETKFNNVQSIHCDFSNEESLEMLISKMNEIKLEVLVNNAITGINKIHFHKTVANDLVSSFHSNVIPTVKISQRAVEIFRKAKYGKLITILSSAISNKPPVGWSTYVAEKNYLLSISKSIATENISFNITSNCISPSFMQTDLNKEVDDRIVEEMKLKHPLKKLLTVDEVAQTVVFYTSATQHINGTNLIINAGSDL